MSDLSGKTGTPGVLAVIEKPADEPMKACSARLESSSDRRRRDITANALPGKSARIYATTAEMAEGTRSSLGRLNVRPF